MGLRRAGGIQSGSQNLGHEPDAAPAGRFLEQIAQRVESPVADSPPHALVAMDPERLDRVERMIADLSPGGSIT